MARSFSIRHSSSRILGCSSTADRRSSRSGAPVTASPIGRRSAMVHDSYPRDRTALLFVDPYNDFLSDGGKLWPLVEGVAKEVGLLDNLRTITATIRKAGIQI